MTGIYLKGSLIIVQNSLPGYSNFYFNFYGPIPYQVSSSPVYLQGQTKLMDKFKKSYSVGDMSDSLQRMRDEQMLDPPTQRETPNSLQHDQIPEGMHTLHQLQCFHCYLFNLFRLIFILSFYMDSWGSRIGWWYKALSSPV